MENDDVIRSRTNSLLKRVGSVVVGKTSDWIVLEGDRLVDDAVAANFDLEVVLVAEDREDRAGELAAAGQSVRRIERELLQRVSALETSPGILALAPRPSTPPLSSFSAKTTPRLLVVAGLQDPGNLGALARSAEAADFCALIVVQGSARPFGPKAIRGSMGSLLRMHVGEFASADEVANHLRESGVRQICAATRGGTNWREFDWSGPLAIWVNGEKGERLESMNSFESVSIPMAGAVESLNVTVATSLLLFAAGGAS